MTRKLSKILRMIIMRLRMMMMMIMLIKK